MLFAVAILLLALLGVIPFAVSLPLALGGIVVSIAFGALMQRNVSRIPIQHGTDAMVGRVGSAVTAVSQRGQVRCGNEIWAARTEGDPISRGQRVGVEGLRVVV